MRIEDLPRPRYLPPWKKTRVRLQDPFQREKRDSAETDGNEVLKELEVEEPEEEVEELLPMEEEEEAPLPPDPLELDEGAWRELHDALVQHCVSRKRTVEQLLALHARIFDAIVAHKLLRDKDELLALIRRIISEDAEASPARLLEPAVPIVPLPSPPNQVAVTNEAATEAPVDEAPIPTQ